MNDPAGELVVSTLSHASELAALASEWWELWAKSPSASPFNSPAWQIAWWRHFGSGALRTCCLRRGGRLVGLLPAHIEIDGSRPPILRLVGNGISDYLDALMLPDWKRDCIHRLASWLRLESGVDRCEFEPLRASSPLLAGDFEGWSMGRRIGEPCPRLNLPDSVAEFERRISPSLLYDLRAARRKAGGPMEIEPAVSGNFHELFEALVELHALRWRARGQSGVMERIVGFHWEVADAFLRRGMLRLYGGRHRGKMIAAFYGFSHRGETAYYLGGFNPRFKALSPGNVMVAHAIAEAIGQGDREFDFLRGAEAYKYRWGAADRQTYSCWMTRLTTGQSHFDSAGPALSTAAAS